MSGIGGPGVLDVQRRQLQGQEPPQTAGVPSAGSGIGQIFKQQLRKRTHVEAPEDEVGPIPIDADMTSGISPLIRFGAGTTLDPVGRVNFLKEEYGEGNVWSRTAAAEPHNLFVRTWVPVPDEQLEALQEILPMESFRINDDDSVDAFRFVQVDPQGKGFDPGEILDIGADIVQAGPSVIGGLVGAASGGFGGAAIGSVVGDVIGSVGRQAASAALPGEEGLTPGERATMLGADVIGGVVGDLGGAAIRRGVEAANPTNMLRKSLVGTPSEVAERGRYLSEKFETPITVGTETQGRTALRLEAMLRQDPGASTQIHESDIIRLKKLGNAAEKIMDRFGGAVGKRDAGEAVANVTKAYLTNLAKARGKAANTLFGRVKALAGDKQIIRVKNFVDTLDRLEAEHSGVLSKGSDSAKAIVKKIQEVRGQLYAERARDKKTGQIRSVRLTAGEFQDDLSAFSKLAAGSGSFIKDLQPSKDRRITAALYDALKKDLDAAADESDLNAQVADALKKARKGYAKMSGVLENSQTALVKEALKLQEKGAPDAISNKLVSSGWSDTQVHEAMRFLDKIDPVAADKARASALSHYLEKAAPTNQGLIGRGVVLSPQQLSTAILKNKDRLEAIMGKRATYTELKELRELAGRLGDTAGTGPGGAQTAPMLWMKRVFEDLGPGAPINPRAFASQVATLMTANRLARALTDAEGRRLVLDVVRLGETPKNALKVAGRLAAWNQREQMSLQPRTPAQKQEADRTQEQATQRAMSFSPAGI